MQEVRLVEAAEGIVRAIGPGGRTEKHIRQELGGNDAVLNPAVLLECRAHRPRPLLATWGVLVALAACLPPALVVGLWHEASSMANSPRRV